MARAPRHLSSPPSPPPSQDTVRRSPSHSIFFPPTSTPYEPVSCLSFSIRRVAWHSLPSSPLLPLLVSFSLVLPIRLSCSRYSITLLSLSNAESIGSSLFLIVFSDYIYNRFYFILHKDIYRYYILCNQL